MQNPFVFLPAAPVPNWFEPQEARLELERLIETFVIREATGQDQAPALALKVTAGVGKTSTTLAVVARHAQALLGRGHVMIYCPTLELAEQAAEDFRALAPQVPSGVLRGRAAANPGATGATMCGNLDIVRQITGIVSSVTHSFCRKSLPDGEVVQAACAAGCPYLAQRDDLRPQVLFLAHSYLTMNPPLDPQVPVALRIVDEKVWKALLRHRRITLDRFLAVPGDTFDRGLLPYLTKAKTAIVEALQCSVPVAEHLAAAGITPAMLADLAHAERAAHPCLDIVPSQSARRVADRINAFDRDGFRAAHQRAAIFEMLADTKTGSTNRLTLRVDTVSGEPRMELRLHDRHLLPRNAPLLMLDADADPVITEQIAPGAQLVPIEVCPQAEIVQISDLVMSNSWLLDAREGPSRRAVLRDLIMAEVSRSAGQGVLLVATKAVLAAFFEDEGRPARFDPAVGGQMLGAAVRWFGPRLQGINDYAGFATVIILGRLQPSPIDLEDDARALFGNDGAPITSHTGALPSTPQLRLTADGNFQNAASRIHPDPRVQAVLAQIRESSTLQAIARLRLVAPKTAKRVVLLSSLPLPGLPISRVQTWRELVGDVTGEPDRVGFDKLEPAICAAMSRGQSGLRLSQTGLAADLPDLFSTPACAKAFRRGRDSAAMVALVLRIAASNGWPATPVTLADPAGGRHPIPAVVFTDRLSAVRAAQAVWPGLSVLAVTPLDGTVGIAA